MNIEQFIYKFTGKSDWKDIEKLKFSVTEVMDIAEKFSSQLEPSVMPIDDTIKMLYEKLRAQISIYAGKKDGGLATLQDLYSAINDGETIVCECCGQRITGKGGHLTGCDIVKKYFKVFGHSVYQDGG